MSIDEDAAPRKMELLAPAGDAAAVDAALEAGADAVYFGLEGLNARRRARNIPHRRLGEIVARIHDRGARAFLTVNIHLAARDLGQAARTLELARRDGADAVLVADPALFALRPHYPELEFHASTQTAVTSSVGVRAMRELGMNRVVLARELALDEIRACAAVDGIETEVFVQGALCCSVSGRCLLSSWGGGRSGNRGACVSPCRAPWSGGGSDGRTWFAMRDLALLHHLRVLSDAGVACVKIEGRMKTADWVGRATSVYRRALDGGDVDVLREEVSALGDYTGRTMTDGYLTGKRDRIAGAPAARPGGDEADPTPPDHGRDGEKDPARPETFNLAIEAEERRFHCRLVSGDHEGEWDVKRSKINRPDRAIALADVGAWLAGTRMQGRTLDAFACSDPEALITRKRANALMDRISSELHRAKKRPDGVIRIDIPDAVRAVVAKSEPHAANRLRMGERPDRARLRMDAAETFLRDIPDADMIVEGAAPARLQRLLDAADPHRIIVALPPVFFEHEIPTVRDIVGRCVEAGATVEANDWAGVVIARDLDAPVEGGPGLPTLNSVAAGFLCELGCLCVTVSPEADRKQLEDFSASCPVPFQMIVYGTPPLLTTRAGMPDAVLGPVLEDRRGLRIRGRREGGLVVFRSDEPFDLTSTRNNRIRAAHYTADLSMSETPVADWHLLGEPDGKPFRFNYDRTLH